MEYAYAAADVLISRAGAMSIAEICVVHKPAVLVPYPYAAEDHQTVNAGYLVKEEAGILVRDGDAARLLVPTLISLMEDAAKRESMTSKLSALAIRDADELIAKHLLQ
jgi:UDP-N-acetylglucosamine--N-acetylmuramyl-(pentapeptide) pyrophosphoryl-undecaprenol N-acetylglucosamine transferase